ncbi:Uncharacterised protein [Mycobacteroides abscessus subsp. massiliense]|nr:Uncharacterised protein [Mycobacteroides abscessus subsp. massiliense]
MEDRRGLAPMDQYRRIPRSSLALVPTEQCVGAQGTGLFTHRRAAGGLDYFAAGNAWGSA